MRIIEAFIEGKKEGVCEDELLITDDFVSVIDGMTAKSQFSLDGKTTGQLASQLLKKCIEQFSPSITATQAVEKLTQEIYQFYIENDVLEKARANINVRLSACAIIFSRARKEIWVIGDCLFMIDEKQYDFPKKIDTLISEARALFVASELKRGKTVEELMNHDTSREYVLPLIKRGAEFQNSLLDDEYTYPAIDGFSIDSNHLKVIQLHQVKQVVLASDGYPKLFPTLKESEKYLQHVLQNDPLCYKLFKSTKGLQKENRSFDDRTYVRFTLNE